MRNLIWLLAMVGCIALGARFHPQSPPPSATPTPEKIKISWKEFAQGQVVFAFEGDRDDCRGIRPFAGEAQVTMPSSRFGPTPLGDLPVRLLAEVELALEEPCRGKKTSELTLTQGARSWTVEIGTYAGPAQSRLIDLMNSSPMPAFREALAAPKS